MDAYDLFRERDRLSGQLSASIKKLRENGVKAAQAEADYQVAKAAAALTLRDAGHPIGMIELLIRGQKGVAEKRLRRDIEKVNYQTNQEHINSVKLQLRLLEAQIEREWGQARRE